MGGRANQAKYGNLYHGAKFDRGVRGMAADKFEATIIGRTVFFTPHRAGEIVSPHEVFLAAMHQYGAEPVWGGFHFRSGHVDRLLGYSGIAGAVATSSFFASEAIPAFAPEFPRDELENRLH